MGLRDAGERWHDPRKKTGKPAPADAPLPASTTSAPKQTPPAGPPVSRPKARPVDFVSEAEIRAALKRKEKIVIGSKTIITPAARDLAAQHDVFAIAE